MKYFKKGWVYVVASIVFSFLLAFLLSFLTLISPNLEFFSYPVASLFAFVVLPMLLFENIASFLVYLVSFILVFFAWSLIIGRLRISLESRMGPAIRSLVLILISSFIFFLIGYLSGFVYTLLYPRGALF